MFYAWRPVKWKHILNTKTFCLDGEKTGVKVASIAGVPVRGEKKAAAGKGEGEEGREPSPSFPSSLHVFQSLTLTLTRCSFLLASNGNACIAG